MNDRGAVEKAEYQRKAWALLPEVCGIVAKWCSGRLSDATVRVEAGELAIRAQEPITVGNVAVIPLRGIITPAPSLLSLLFGGGGGLRGFRQAMRSALGDDSVESILIDVDSPGGVTDLVPETAAELRAARGEKPITAIANTLSASAAYWLMSQADTVVATPSGFAGSIGVYAVHENWSGFNERMGIEPTYISAGKYKTDTNPDEPLSKSGRDEMQRTVDHFYGLFTKDVAAGRGTTVEKVVSDMGEGRVLTADDALNAGLVDQIASFEDTIAEMTGRGRRSPVATVVPLRVSAGGVQKTIEVRVADDGTVEAQEVPDEEPPAEVEPEETEDGDEEDVPAPVPGDDEEGDDDEDEEEEGGASTGATGANPSEDPPTSAPPGASDESTADPSSPPQPESGASTGLTSPPEDAAQRAANLLFS